MFFKLATSFNFEGLSLNINTKKSENNSSLLVLCKFLSGQSGNPTCYTACLNSHGVLNQLSLHLCSRSRYFSSESKCVLEPARIFYCTVLFPVQGDCVGL